MKVWGMENAILEQVQFDQIQKSFKTPVRAKGERQGVLNAIELNML